ncbi:MAG: LON peptidase substrate-binding domain-containing protein [Caulobacteraceae bacterium]
MTEGDLSRGRKTCPRSLPLFPLDGALVLPHASRPFNIFEPRYLNMLDDVMAAERIIGMVQTAPGGPWTARSWSRRLRRPRHQLRREPRRPLPDHPDRGLPLPSSGRAARRHALSPGAGRFRALRPGPGAPAYRPRRRPARG